MNPDLASYDEERLKKVIRALGPGNDPRSHRNLMRVIDACRILDSQDRETLLNKLSDDQRKLVELVREVRRTKLGRNMIEAEASHDVWLAVQNDANQSGCYFSDVKLISLTFKNSGGNNARDSFDLTAGDNWAERGQYLKIKNLFHESAHFCQHEIWQNGLPPPGLRSVDQKLWDLSTESQAMMIASMGMQQLHPSGTLSSYQGPIISADYDTDPTDLRHWFLYNIYNDPQHKKYYGLNRARVDDGTTLPVDTYVRAFGFLPGLHNNFLDGSVHTINDVHASILRSGDIDPSTLKSLFKGTAQPVDMLTDADLTRALKPGEKRLISPERDIAVMLSLQNGRVLVHQYDREILPDGRTAYRLSTSGNTLAGNDVTFIPLHSTHEGDMSDVVRVTVKAGQIRSAALLRPGANFDVRFIAGDRNPADRVWNPHTDNTKVEGGINKSFSGAAKNAPPVPATSQPQPPSPTASLPRPR